MTIHDETTGEGGSPTSAPSRATVRADLARRRGEGGPDGPSSDANAARSSPKRRAAGADVGDPPLVRFAVVPAAYVYLLREATGGVTEVLLQLRQNTGYMDDHWAAAAAGHVEQGETAYDAAHREALEEIAVADIALEFVTAMQRTAHGPAIDERIDFFFTARSWVGEPQIVEPDKCAELRWFALDALPEPVVPHEAAVLAGLRDDTLTPYSSFGF